MLPESNACGSGPRPCWTGLAGVAGESIQVDCDVDGLLLVAVVGFIQTVGDGPVGQKVVSGEVSEIQIAAFGHSDDAGPRRATHWASSSAVILFRALAISSSCLIGASVCTEGSRAGE